MHATYAGLFHLCLGLDTFKRCRYWHRYCFKQYIFSFLKGTLNDNNHCDVIIY